MVSEFLKKQVSLVSTGENKPAIPLVLAYIGDAVYEVFIRTMLISEGNMVHILHKKSIKYVKAKVNPTLSTG